MSTEATTGGVRAHGGQSVSEDATGGLRPRWRLPLLMLAFVALFVGTGAGLARLGWRVPELAAGAAGLHGPLMICGFFGTVIALERAVAIGRRWAYAGPLAAGCGAFAALAGATAAGAWLFVAGSAVLLAGSADIWRRQQAMFTFTLAFGATCWTVGCLLWANGFELSRAVPWWLAFLVLTIAGERLELSRFLPPSPIARRIFAALLSIVTIGLVLGSLLPPGAGDRLFAAGLLGLAGWLLKQDIARRTVRGTGLTRYIAVCLLSGYAWLAVGGAVALLGGGFDPGNPGRDAALHALALGFVFSMVFGHAPIIFPAVLRVAVPYQTWFYLPLALLHASLALRLLGDATASFELTRAGALANGAALLAFLLGTAAAVLRGKFALRR
ncbi:MAG TPA: hypothetical protein PK177_02875 [Burkholderiaceae bacterium]|nr:hypothetical protein [Burkholderiaceae bacterium]